MVEKGGISDGKLRHLFAHVPCRPDSSKGAPTLAGMRGALGLWRYSEQGY